MALRQVYLNHEIGEKKSFLEALREKATGFETRKADLKKRESEIAEAINEQTPDTDEETKAAVEKAVEEFEQEAEKLEEEIKENADEIAKVEEEVARMQEELDALSETPPAPPAVPTTTENNNRSNERSYAHMRVRALDRMNIQERAAFVNQNEVKDFITRSRDIILRDIANVEVTVPSALLPMIREEVERNSKLTKYVYYVKTTGKDRIPIMGEIPDPVWTEACGKLNKLDWSMYMVEIDAYKIGGYSGICKYLVEDSNEDLLDMMLDGIAAGIARGVDKAILFGTGIKMPMGIVTRLLQSAAPEGSGIYAPAWKDLRDSNVATISAANSVDKKLIQGIIAAYGKADHKRTGNKFFAMNEMTHMHILSELLNYNINGALVAGMTDKMPIIGADIVIIDAMPDNLIVGGHGINYVIGQRGDMFFDTNDKLEWIEERILVKGTARYDGKPTRPAAFVAIGINGVVPATAAATVTFRIDEANQTAT